MSTYYLHGERSPLLGKDGSVTSWSAALDALVRERGPALYGYAFVLTGDRDAAEDLVHDALVRTFKRGRHRGGIDSTHAYVKAAIASGFVDGYRRASVRPKRAPGDAGDPEMAPVAAISDPAEGVGGAVDLHRALLTLPPRERACVVLRYLEDKPTAAVAHELGISTGAVKRYLSDGLARLRATYGELDLPAEDESAIPIPIVTHRGAQS